MLATKLHHQTYASIGGVGIGPSNESPNLSAPYPRRSSSQRCRRLGIKSRVRFLRCEM